MQHLIQRHIQRFDLLANKGNALPLPMNTLKEALVHPWISSDEPTYLQITNVLSLQGIEGAPLVSFNGNKTSIGLEECREARTGNINFLKDHGRGNFFSFSKNRDKLGLDFHIGNLGESPARALACRGGLHLDR